MEEPDGATVRFSLQALPLEDIVLVRSERSHEDQGRNLVVATRLGDDAAAPGMTDRMTGPVCASITPFRGRDVVCAGRN